MPLDPLTFALAVCVPLAYLAGALIMRSACRRQHAEERAQLEHEMTAEIQERYAAYVALEKEVRRIFLRLDALEVKTQRSLEATGVHLRTLGNVLDACEGKSSEVQHSAPAAAAQIAPPGNAADEALSWMSDLDEHFKVYGDDEEPLSAAAPAQAAKADDMVQWERKLETLREEKRAEIDRQGQVIAELTERLQRLQVAQSQDEVAAKPQDDRPTVLAKEVLLWQEKYATLQRERTHDEAEVLALREETASLSRQVAELEPLQATCASLQQRLRSLEQTLTARDEELVRARGETRTEAERASMWERRHREVEDQRQAQVESLEQRVRELEPLQARAAELATQVEATEQREAAQRERAVALESEGKRLMARIESLREDQKAAAEMLRASKRALEESDTRLQGLEQRLSAQTRESEQRVEELEERVQSLSARNDALSDDLNNTRRNSEGQTSRISTLMSQLDEVRQESDVARREAELRGEMVHAAEGLLAELKPKLEALEARLNTKR
jgi:chromosome segregation ATPase